MGNSWPNTRKIVNNPKSQFPYYLQNEIQKKKKIAYIQSKTSVSTE